MCMEKRKESQSNLQYKNKFKKSLIITISVIAILAIIYFISEEFFYEVTSLILTIFIIGLPVLIISSPFILIKKQNKKPTKKDIFVAILISLMYLIVISIIYYFLIIWAIGKVSEAFLSTF